MDRKQKYILGGLFAVVTLLVVSQRQKIINVIKSMGKSDFIKLFYPIAEQVQRETGVPKEVILAQAGLESGWGGAVFGNNFFGIKAGQTWKGLTQELKTWECGKTGDPKKDGITDKVIQIFPPGDSNGVCDKLYSYRVYGTFRKYSSVKEGFKDHANFLLTNSRYKKAFDFKNNPKEFATQIAAAGYATDPDYAGKLHSIIDIIKTVV